jgi:hypothetical protein
LARLFERLMVAALPALGASGCTSDSPEDHARDLAFVDLAPRQCKTLDDPCLWLTVVDAGTPSDASYSWTPDGSDTCAPCAFASRPGVYCGTCGVVSTFCGVAYYCSTLECSDSCGFAGRRPAGLLLPSLPAGEPFADWLANMAHLEAASVPAFARLIRELEAHEAPAQLIAGAARALRDEERHARRMSALARASGAPIAKLEVAPTKPRSLDEIAQENAVEGCVRESLGALTLAERASHVADPVLARVFADIAVDEVRHANLAWAIQQWAWPHLSRAARARVAAAAAKEARALVSRTHRPILDGPSQSAG